jgi:hypothetical protein
MIIGILGRSRVGKDTVANILCKHLGQQALILRLSQPLKDAVQALYGFTHAQLEQDEKDVIDPRFGLTPREVIQHICQDTMLRHGQDFFSRKMYFHEVPKHPNKTIIIPDVRYDHDIKMIHEQGGFLIKVIRSHGPPKHPWEDPIDAMEGDHCVMNDTSIEELEAKIKEIIDTVSIAEY